jgi:DNA repair protein SbcC/Rad50
MIPIKLTLSGFLSYHDLVELDFSSFDLACISGPNGAGKSSLLDAITWALFGQARKRDESVVNLRSNAAEVIFVFAYEGSTYRVQRTLPKGKTSMLEFQILEPLEGKWKPLTGHTLRDTQYTIEHTLRLDYETFVNASFFLQGKADQFTQQKASDRKRILGSILGLEVWEVYRERVIKRRRETEAEIQNLDGRMQEINAELNEEQARNERLATLQAELKRLAKQRKAQEKLLEQAHQVEAALIEQRKLVDMLGRQLQSTHQRQAELENRIASRIQERESYSQLIARAEEIQASHTGWLALRAELERWDEVAMRFREHDARRQAPLMQIEAERARLQQELASLQAEDQTVKDQGGSVGEIENQLNIVRKELQQSESNLMHRAELDEQLQTARLRLAEAKAENPRLKAEMLELRERIDKLEAAEGVECPLCGRPLEPSDRVRLVDELKSQGSELGDRYRSNQTLINEAEQTEHALRMEMNSLSRSEDERVVQVQSISRLENQVDAIHKRSNEWQQKGAPHLAEVQEIIATQTFSLDARQLLAEIDVELKAIGYDAAAHDICRKQEAASRPAENEYRALESARSALLPLQREISEGEQQLEALYREVKQQQQECDDAVARLAAAEAAAPDLEAAERLLHEILEQENSQRMEVGAAQQKVLVLKDLKVRLKELTAQREALARLVSQYKLLDRAFGKDGVPALLIEQALPEIEMRANELLERLSEGNMSVRFVTQAAFKDKKRDDLRETLDILISDGAGTRDYELYSGGEAFRVNFAIRLALSELLAKRAGARLQTLVVDEGFGSQDAQGRQHLIEAINQVKQDFAKVLVISHIDELKEAFPNRIEVEKTEHGSTLRVV